MSKRILAIHAHPDDVEILAGGTLALLARAGYHVMIATMSPGDCGTAEYDAEVISATRRQEARNSAARIGAEYYCLEFRDLAVFNDDPSRRRVTHFLRQVRPDLVLTGSPIDYMCDHEATSRLVRDACFGAPIRNYAPGAEPVLEAIPHLYYMDAVSGRDPDDNSVAADFYVDVAGVFDVKRNMLAEHQSQRSWLLKHHGMDNYLIQMEFWTRLMGSRAGLEMAEGFRRYKGHAYPQNPLLEELLASHVAKPLS